MKTMLFAVVLLAAVVMAMGGYLAAPAYGHGYVRGDSAVTYSYDNQRAAPYGGYYGYGYPRHGYGHGYGYGGYGYPGSYGGYYGGHLGGLAGYGYGHGLGYGYGYGHGYH